MLDTGGGNLLYWEDCGNPQGIPALVVHGGPGSGCPPGRRRGSTRAATRSSSSISGIAAGARRTRATRPPIEPQYDQAPDSRHGAVTRPPRRRDLASARRV